MKRVVFALCMFVLSFGSQAQTLMAMTSKPATDNKLQLSLPSLQDQDQSRYTRRGDRLLLMGIGMNLASAGAYLMVPNFYKKAYNPITEYYYALDVAKDDPAKTQQVHNYYQVKLAEYDQAMARRSQKIKNARLACLAAFSVGMTLDLAAVLNFKKGRS